MLRCEEEKFMIFQSMHTTCACLLDLTILLMNYAGWPDIEHTGLITCSAGY